MPTLSKATLVTSNIKKCNAIKYRYSNTSNGGVTINYHTRSNGVTSKKKHHVNISNPERYFHLANYTYELTKLNCTNFLT